MLQPKPAHVRQAEDPAAKKIGQAYRQGTAHYIDAGKMLNAKKASFGDEHGAWSAWLRTNEKALGFSERTAQRLMAWARDPALKPEEAWGNIWRDVHGKPSSTSAHKPTEFPRDPKEWEAMRKCKRPLFDADEFLRSAMRGAEEAEQRIAEGATRAEWMEAIVSAGYKALATKHHPDAGGSQQAMTRLNAARDELRNLVRRAIPWARKPRKARKTTNGEARANSSPAA